LCLLSFPLLPAREVRGPAIVHPRWHHRLRLFASAILLASYAASRPLTLCRSPKETPPACDAFAPVSLLTPGGGERSPGPCWSSLLGLPAKPDRTWPPNWSSRLT